MPSHPIRLRDALIGAVMARLIFELSQEAFGLCAHSLTDTLVYGAFAAVPVFLLWVYI